ncbi:MAG TPA: ATP-binding domain-containing protein [Candidatus Dormibacteraeota bacterium]|nr:ATP-binding domain-containing protein [Candidatus Dormibacteraeota bacterium]
MTSPIVSEELALLAAVRRALEEHPESAGPSEASALAELGRLREQLLSGRGADDRAAALLEYNRQEALVKQLRTARDRPRVAAESPYFGHLRLREQNREWDICLGKATFIAGGVSIVDWRNAPVSRLFYRYEQGDDYEEEIAGRARDGTVTVRRTVTVRGAALQRIDAPEGTFRRRSDGSWDETAREAPRLQGGEGAALRVYQSDAVGERQLGAAPDGVAVRADKHLPDIAGLIDPAQFELITKPSSGLVVVRGTAGSGKTTVALHRIAYLAYADPAVDGDRTLVVVFSRALRDYVSHVLPALGVRRARVCTFQEWAREQRRRHFPMLPRETRDDAPAVVQRLKSHPVMLEILAAQVRRGGTRASARQAVDDWGSALGDAPLLADVVERTALGAFSREQLERAAAWCGRRYRDLLAFLAGEDPTPVELSPEDDALLLRAFQLRVGRLRDSAGSPLELRHVAIDEVQDFSPLEVRVLIDCLDEGRSMTLAGDTQQHVLQDAGFASWNDFFRHLGLAGTEVDTLRVAYRSTHEIVEFALSLLGDLREDDTPPETTRSGPPVELFRFTDHGAAVAFLAAALKRLAAREPLASAVLLAPSAEVAGLYHRALEAAEVPRLAWVQDQRFSFAPGVEVAEVADVKGLEFDYVVLLEASSGQYPDTPASRRRLHVGATRAIHQLWLTSVATPSPLLRDAIAGGG